MSYKKLNLPDQVRNDTWNFIFLIKDTSNQVVDITGMEYWLTVKENLDDTDLVAGVQVGPVSVSPANAALGKIEISVSPLQTNLEAKTYYYDLQEVDSSGKVSTLLLGKVKVQKDVTLTSNYSGTITQSTSSAGTAIYVGTTEALGVSEIFVDNILNNRLGVALDGTLAFDALVTGKDTVTKESCAFQLNGALENDSNLVTIIGSVGKFILGTENSAFDANIVADDVNNSLKLEVTPSSANLTEWRARVSYTEIS